MRDDIRDIGHEWTNDHKGRCLGGEHVILSSTAKEHAQEECIAE